MPHRGYKYFSASVLLMVAAFWGCSFDQDQATMQESESIFPKGELAPENNTGKVWVEFLVSPDSIYMTAAGNESFAPGARTHWHTHPAGEILMVTEGVGYHKMEGKPRQVIRKGDVVKCPPNTKHWHGAKEDSSMAHIFIVPNTEKGIVEWGEEVTDP